MSVTRKVTISNPNDKPIGYSLKVLGDHSKMFAIDKSRPIINVSPKSTVKISITFSAKKLTSVKGKNCYKAVHGF